MSEDVVPNPGSDEAIKQGCTCAVIDNGHGKGAMGGSVRGDNGEPLFWISQDCPLHGEQSHET